MRFRIGKFPQTNDFREGCSPFRLWLIRYWTLIGFKYWIQRLHGLYCLKFHKGITYGLPAAGYFIKTPYHCYKCDYCWEIWKRNRTIAMLTKEENENA